MKILPLKSLMSVRTDFSLGKSVVQIKPLVKRAKELGYEAIVLSDFMTVSAAPMFAAACKKEGVTPVIGVTLFVVSSLDRLKPKELQPCQIRVFPKNENGMQEIYRVLSLANDPDHYYYEARLTIEEVCSMKDVLVTSGDFSGLFSTPHKENLERVQKLQATFGGDFAVELVALDTPLYKRANATAEKFAKEHACSRLIARPVLHIQEEDYRAKIVHQAICENTSVDSPWIARPYIKNQCVLPVAEHTRESLLAMGSKEDLIEVMKESQFFFSKVSFEVKKQDPALPKMAPDEYAALVLETKKGWRERFSAEVWGHKPNKADLASIYIPRLKYELSIIGKMGFSGYFLLVQDIVQWSKKNGILVGPGRGSVGGSLIAYLMGITDCDPIRFNLLFERFINPERIDLPDADLDFMTSRRHEVIDYVKEKYGSEYVCGIVNFSTLGPASALRDSARISGLNPLEYACSKLVEKEHGVSLSLEESADSVPEIAKFRDTYPQIWDTALRLEGVNRNLGQHAAGVVVAGVPVNTRAVISTRGGAAALPVAQWDKSEVENFGLIKIDVLGLTTLDTIATAKNYIRERHGVEVDTLKLPLDDKKVLKGFREAKTSGVFQFESSGMKGVLTQMGLKEELTFDDVCAVTALFRPGPLDAGLCDQYIRVKQGLEVPSYPHPALENCLRDTFGVMVYQEQTMQVSRDLAGFSPAEADVLRKAIGKKDAAKMATMKDKFIEGASAGFAEVELEDGTIKKVHLKRKLRVKESEEKFTVEEIFAKGLTIEEVL